VLRLVGSEGLVHPDGGDLLKFYGGVFPRLASEVPNVGHLSRYVAFRNERDDGREARFLGIEVESFSSVPDGMIAWELGDAALIRWIGSRSPESEHREPISWTWQRESPTTTGRWLGEFSAGGSPLLCAANCYVGPKRGAGSADDVRIVDYDPTWPRQAAEAAAWLSDALGDDVALSIEHYGSTAVPGLPAKPIVDLLVEVPGLSAAAPVVLTALNDPAWEYWWYAGHMTFVRRDGLGGRRTHHVHMAPRSHPVWRGLAFRDWLRTHPDDAARYAALKHALAETWRTERERYTIAKTRFVEEITARAEG
jgi:GrpB-like predicted nucleotidyltransferase (UPF0157 family)